MRAKSKQGLTLVEIIVAIAILGIVFVAFQQMFYNGYFSVITSGQRTKAIMDVQEIVDDVTSKPFENKIEIEQYLETRYGELGTFNWSIGDLTLMNDVYGYPVQFVLFFGKNTQKVQMTAFVIDQDANGG